MSQDGYPWGGPHVQEEIRWAGRYTAHGWWPVFGFSVNEEGRLIAHFAETELITSDSGGTDYTQLLGVEPNGAQGTDLAEGIHVYDMPELINERPEYIAQVAEELARMAAVLAPLVGQITRQQGRGAIDAMIESADERITAHTAWAFLHLMVEAGE